MATAPLIAGLPNSPLVDPLTGNINPEWRGFLQNLWARTGGAVGIPSDTTNLQNQLAVETAARVAGDDSLHTQITNEAAARTAGDSANASALNTEASTRGVADANEIAARSYGDQPATWAARNYSGLPTSNPGGGQVWLNAGNLHVGP
jgi:hypothetical protein